MEDVTFNNPEVNDGFPIHMNPKELQVLALVEVMWKDKRPEWTLVRGVHRSVGFKPYDIIGIEISTGLSTTFTQIQIQNFRSQHSVYEALRCGLTLTIPPVKSEPKPEVIPDPIATLNLDDLKLSIRARQILEREKIITAKQIDAMSDEQLLKIEGLGKSTLAVIRDAVAMYRKK